MLRVLIRVVADAMIVAVVLFAAAGSLAWWRAWVLVVLLIVIRGLSAILVYRVNPALLRERATVLVHDNQPSVDRALLLVFMGAAFIGMPAVAAADVFHWHLLPQPPITVSTVGLGLFALGWAIIGLALRTNPFAVTVVRVQAERRHSVVDTGIYGVIRHPMYTGNSLVNVGLALWLGSYAAALFAAIPLGLLMMRIGLEERFLRRELPGYVAYTSRVPYRLVPGLW
jgi:protein-S-isoprenylcysteine O-methyltransferase Ste14